MKKLPLGIQSIRKILKEDRVYIDKTGFAFDLIENGTHYFISRPRRFGKSLFLKTLEEIFKGNRNLFRGLAIETSHYDWKEYPVLYFDFAQIISETPQDFKSGLEDAIEDVSKAYGIAISGSSYTSKIKRLVTTLSKKIESLS